MFNEKKRDGFARFDGWVAVGGTRANAALTAQFTMISGKIQHVSPSRIEMLAETGLTGQERAVVLAAYHSRP